MGVPGAASLQGSLLFVSHTKPNSTEPPCLLIPVAGTLSHGRVLVQVAADISAPANEPKPFRLPGPQFPHLHNEQGTSNLRITPWVTLRTIISIITNTTNREKVTYFLPRFL